MSTLPSRYGIGEAVTIRTDDGQRLDAVHLPGANRAIGIVLAHGFTASWHRPANVRVATGLARQAGVLAFDFRGHGRSTGRCTVGDREILDVDAVVRAARRLGYRKVVTCGWSMGGAVVIRQAALLGGVDAVVSVSAPARWFYRDTRAMRRVHWIIERRLGRVAARLLLHTRVSGVPWQSVPESPEELVGRIAPTPLLIVHGDRDPFFPIDHAQALAAAAGAPTELWIVPGFGHAEGAAGTALLDRLGRRLPDLLVGAS